MRPTRLLESVETPAYVIDTSLLRRNLQILDSVQQQAGCTILLALKGFAAWSTFPIVSQTLKGVCASSPHEARLGREIFGGQVHSYAPAYSEAGFEEILTLSDHVIFNSISQLERFRPRVMDHQGKIQFGVRINPQHSEVEVALYDPCAAGSRLGVTRDQLRGADLTGIDGLHFHTLCELGSDALQRTLAAVEQRFGEWLPQMRWVNFGGGHHITRQDYDRDLLVRLVQDFKAKHGVEVFLEPGEAIALNTGVLVASVLDIVQNNGAIAILDTSASAHMPDVLEMPYRPRIVGASEPGKQAHTYRLGGMTCLAGDVIGDYSFESPLQVGDRLIFEDMAHYTMVKNTTFNGVRLPSIALMDPEAGTIEVVRRFGYEDYRARLS